MIPRLRAPLLVLGALALAGEARADGALVTLVRARGAGALVQDATTRLSAELGAAGFTVRVVEGSAGADARAEVEGVEGSFATIAIVPIGRAAAADVWIADRVTGKTVVRRVDVADPAAPTAASDLAVRSVELLRASLLEIHERAPAGRELPAAIARFAATRPSPAVAPPIVSPAPLPPSPAGVSPPRPSPPSPPAAPVAASGPRAGVEAAAGLLASTQGGASVGPVLRLALDLPRRFSLRLTAAPPVSKLTLAAPQGTVDVRQWLTGLDLAYAFTSEEARLRPMVALGGGVHGLRVDGSALQGYVGEHHDTASAFVAAGAGLGVRLTDGLAALADLETLVLLPARTVTAVGVPLAHLGRPAFLPTLGLVTSF